MPTRTTSHLSVLLATAVAAGGFAGAGDWPQFRGPGGLGVSRKKGLPTVWSADKNVLWRADLPGAGASSPIVVGDRSIFDASPAVAGWRLLLRSNRALYCIGER